MKQCGGMDLHLRRNRYCNHPKTTSQASALQSPLPRRLMCNSRVRGKAAADLGWSPTQRSVTRWALGQRGRWRHARSRPPGCGASACGGARTQTILRGRPNFLHLRRSLQHWGWADGPNLRMEIRWGGGNVNRASVFAKELVALQPDVILAQGTPVTAALKRETRTIQIVFATVLAKRRAETYDCVETC